ncbi:MAG: hypothetical protein AAF335_02680 [Bacteroidota bacterium]
MKKTKEDATSAGTPKKKKPENKGRLSSMLESMQKRSSPVNAHKVATKYFDDFKKDRSIDPSRETSKKITAVDSGADTVESTQVNTAVDSAVITAVDKKSKKPSPSRPLSRISQHKILEDSHTKSELKVYLVMKEETDKKKSANLRFGLKDLKEKTGLSDKTIRNAVHSLEKKLSIKVVEPSLGVYGRKIQVFSPEEIGSMRKKSGLLIDSTTKRIIEQSTAIDSTVDTAVTTAVDLEGEYKNQIIKIYKKYTGNNWDDKADKFFQQIKNLTPESAEAAFILGILKDGQKNKHISEFKDLLKNVGDNLSNAHIGYLRDIWKERKVK